jgi:hypothetical protein
LDADEAASCDQAPADRGSGRRAPLPRLNACFEYRSGELIRFVEDREGRGVGFRALNAAFDTTTSAGAPPRRSRWRSPRRGPNRIRQCSTDRAAFSSSRTGGRLRVMTLEKLRHAQHLIADQSRSIPAICRELDDMPASTFYHYLHADGSLKAPGHKLLGMQTQADSEDLWGPPSGVAAIDRRRAHVFV